MSFQQKKFTDQNLTHEINSTLTAMLDCVILVKFELLVDLQRIIISRGLNEQKKLYIRLEL